jgi:hypothetical protein
MAKEVEVTVQYHGGPKDGATERIRSSVIDAANKGRRTGSRYVADPDLSARKGDGAVHVRWVTK